MPASKGRGMNGEEAMSEVKHTPVPWRLRTRGNIGNTIEADSGKRYDSLDDGFRVVAMYQECCASDRCLDEQENRDANGAFIVEAVNNYESLRAKLAKATAALEACRTAHCGYAIT